MKFDKIFLPENLKNKKIQRIGFPRVENFDMSLLLQQEGYRNLIKDNLVDMDDPEVDQNIKDKIEFVIDMTEDDHQLQVDLKKNKTRAEEQKKLREDIVNKEKEDGTYDQRIDKNVLLIYIDNISRAHFIRKMSKTVKWLERFVDNESSEIATYQYLRYHSSMYATSGNNAALYYGQFRDVRNASTNIFDSYSNNGYITAFVPDICEYAPEETSNIHLKGMNRWDHHAGPYSCDPNYDAREDGSLNWFKGAQSASRH